MIWAILILGLLLIFIILCLAALSEQLDRIEGIIKRKLQQPFDSWSGKDF